MDFHLVDEKSRPWAPAIPEQAGRPPTLRPGHRYSAFMPFSPASQRTRVWTGSGSVLSRPYRLAPTPCGVGPTIEPCEASRRDQTPSIQEATVKNVAARRGANPPSSAARIQYLAWTDQAPAGRTQGLRAKHPACPKLRLIPTAVQRRGAEDWVEVSPIATLAAKSAHRFQRRIHETENVLTHGMGTEPEVPWLLLAVAGIADRNWRSNAPTGDRKNTHSEPIRTQTAFILVTLQLGPGGCALPATSRTGTSTSFWKA